MTPHWHVSIAEPAENGGGFSKIGVGWTNSTGTISITLNPYVHIPPRQKLKIVLVPNDGQTYKATE